MRPRLSRRTGLLLATGLVALALSGPAGAAAPDSAAAGTARWTMIAPGAEPGVTATVALSRGRLSLTVRHGSTAVVEPSVLGIRTAEADFTTGLRYAGRSERVIREAYTTLTGKRRQHLAEARETTLRFVAQGRRMDLVLRIAPDGVAYRYVLPAAGWVTVPGEASEFAVPPAAEAFLLPWDNGRHDDRLFAQYKQWGVVGLKIDFPEYDGQDRMRWYEAVLTDAARHQLMINFHGCTIPRGWERTWPHMLTMESVRGGEGTRRTPGRVPYPASHYVTVPFTRNLAGPMDWTPVTFSGVRPTSDAHELALSVIYESGLQHWADSPETYAAYPLAERFLRVAPVVWDDTRLLSGLPGDHVVLARRSGDDWFVGAGTAGPARTIDAPLDFLPAGQWLADVYHDGDAGALTLTTRSVSNAGRLVQAVATDGGFAAHLCPATPGRTTCGS